jgi:hypothetical protein
MNFTNAVEIVRESWKNTEILEYAMNFLDAITLLQNVWKSSKFDNVRNKNFNNNQSIIKIMDILSTGPHLGGTNGILGYLEFNDMKNLSLSSILLSKNIAESNCLDERFNKYVDQYNDNMRGDHVIRDIFYDDNGMISYIDCYCHV